MLLDLLAQASTTQPDAKPEWLLGGAGFAASVAYVAKTIYAHWKGDKVLADASRKNAFIESGIPDQRGCYMHGGFEARISAVENWATDLRGDLRDLRDHIDEKFDALAEKSRP